MKTRTKFTQRELSALLDCVNAIEAGGQFGDETTDIPDLKQSTIEALKLKLRAELEKYTKGSR